MYGGFHASLNGNIDLIVAERALHSGKALHDWLGSGRYIYRIGSDSVRSPAAAYGDAIRFARRKFPNRELGCIFVEVDDRRSLNLQQREILEALSETDRIVKKRAEAIGLNLEQETDWVRPQAHLSIDLFLAVLRQLYPHPVDVIEAEFRGKITGPVEEIRSPEICIKSQSAILNIYRVRSFADIPPEAASGSDAPRPSNLLIKAAQQVPKLIQQLDDGNFADLVIRVFQGEGGSQNRFKSPRAVALVVQGNTKLSEEVQTAWRKVSEKNFFKPEVRFLGDVKSSSGPEELRKIEGLVSSFNGLAVFVDAGKANTNSIDVTLSSILTHARQKDCPLLLIGSEGAQIPSEMRSTQRISFFRITPTKRQREVQLEAILSGFMADNWQRGTEKAALELIYAARSRECSTSRLDSMLDRHSVLKRVAEHDAYVSTLDVELPGLAESCNEAILHGLNLDPEIAAEELRNRLDVRDFAVKNHVMLRALGSPKVLSIDMLASGFFLQAGPLRSGKILVLRERDIPTRKRFTMAHEIGHAIIDSATRGLPPNIEDWCDRFAAAFLMPRSLVAEFSAKTVSLEDWLDLPKVFDVSASAAARRAWECSRKLLVFYPSAQIISSPLPDVARQLIKIGEKAGFHGVRGNLSCDAPFAARRKKNNIDAIADFQGIAELP